ncbi:MAG: polymerase [Rhodospirillales bacterium]|jgi:uracil-DNA glycosylase family protein|nr:polymerase [Rhodospirillales bacterium]
MAIKLPPDSAARFLPENPTDLAALRDAAAGCTACPLHQLGTQTVFGEGSKRADVMLVGEQPGDAEDIAGKPFVGPAGKLLDRALKEAGIDRRKTYVTNAVKHFKWVPRGKRRIHSSPNTMEIRACNPWLKAEILAVRPRVLVCLGAIAAAAVIGPKFRVTKDRGRFVPSEFAPYVVGTIHPSMLLRLEDEESKRIEYGRLVEDLRLVHDVLAQAA